MPLSLRHQPAAQPPDPDAADPTVTLLDIEMTFRDGGRLIACQGKTVQVVFGMKDWLAALKAALFRFLGVCR